MRLTDSQRAAERAMASYRAAAALAERVVVRRASALVAHRRPRAWVRDPRTGLLAPDQRSYVDVDPPELVHNVKTNVGIVFTHTQTYGTSPGANGLNYIALSNDSLTENAASTTLSSEIAANGLSRAQGTVTLPTGSGTQTTVARTFTCATAPQAAQKAALFSASSAGTMHHALAFTQRSLQVGDQLSVTFTLTIS